MKCSAGFGIDNWAGFRGDGVEEGSNMKKRSYAMTLLRNSHWVVFIPDYCAIIIFYCSCM